MKTLFAILATALYVSNAHAMPCDVSNSHYSCVSSSKKYTIELQFCGYDNHVKGASAQIDGKEMSGANENVWYGAKFLGAQFNAEDAGGSERSLTMEISQKSLSGTITEQSRDGNPAPWNQIAAEKISCKVSSDE